MLYEAVWKSQWGSRNKRTQTDTITSLTWTLLFFSSFCFAFFFFRMNSFIIAWFFCSNSSLSCIIEIRPLILLHFSLVEPLSHRWSSLPFIPCSSCRCRRCRRSFPSFPSLPFRPPEPLTHSLDMQGVECLPFSLGLCYVPCFHAKPALPNQHHARNGMEW